MRKVSKMYLGQLDHKFVPSVRDSQTGVTFRARLCQHRVVNRVEEAIFTDESARDFINCDRGLLTSVAADEDDATLREIACADLEAKRDASLLPVRVLPARVVVRPVVPLDADSRSDELVTDLLTHLRELRVAVFSFRDRDDDDLIIIIIIIFI